MGPKQRAYFDRQVDRVVARLPCEVKDIIVRVPLCVEDAPSRAVCREMKLTSPSDLCGLFVGAPERDELSFPTQPSTVFLYRRGLFEAAADDDGFVDTASLRREIKVTILHELGHFHGLDEGDLDALGYG